MPIVVRNIRLNIDEPEEMLLDRVAKKLRIAKDAIRHHSILRRALDARRRDEIHFVYHLELTLTDGPAAEKNKIRRLHDQNVALIEPQSWPDPVPGAEPLSHRPVIVGFGPAGMFAALRLAEFGHRPIVLERGRDVSRRHYDILKKYYRDREFTEESNLLFGEGGAGTYSDGKLYTRRSDPLHAVVLEMLYRHGADPRILTDARPHVGSEKLPTICRRIRQKIEALGGEVRFDAKLEDMEFSNAANGRKVARLLVSGQWIDASAILLAIGHSARDSIRMLADRGVRIEAKPFQIGVRVEHPQPLVDRWQYAELCGHESLPPAEYHVVAKGAGREMGDVFSFCMCPGGMILPSQEKLGIIATNGASPSRRNLPFANSGLVITMPPERFGGDPLAGLAFQEQCERRAWEATEGSQCVPAQRATDFLAGRTSDGNLETSYPLGGRWTDVRTLLPDDVIVALQRAVEMLDKRMPGFAGSDGLVTAPETRASAPIRMTRHHQTRQSIDIEGLFPIGEGAGYAGGIVTAAIDGLKTADTMITNHAPAR
jgi:uncharacterized FAD-dependent dehydrogenase